MPETSVFNENIHAGCKNEGTLRFRTKIEKHCCATGFFTCALRVCIFTLCLPMTLLRESMCGEEVFN